MRGSAIALGLAVGWLTLLIYPQPLFAYSVHQNNLVLYARTPLPEQAGPILDEAQRRIARSPLYDPTRTQHAFLCDTPALFAFLTLTNRSGGKTNPFGNVFIRPANVARNRVIDRFGNEKSSARSLTYYLAHELTHALTFDHLGFRQWANPLSAFQIEGYADYVGMSEPIDLRAGRAALISNAPEMDPTRSGLYTRYSLLVAYLLERRGYSVEQLLARRIQQRDVEAELRLDTGQ